MALEHDYDFSVLKNESEKWVLAELNRQLDVLDGSICLCNTCVVDMAAMALNTVKPLYRVSLLGAQYTAQAMNEPLYADSVRDAVVRAIERVAANPAHD